MKHYYRDKIVKPYSLSKTQDLWIGTVSEGNHFHMIEVRDETEAGLRRKLDVIVQALNDDESLISVIHRADTSSYDRAMKGI